MGTLEDALNTEATHGMNLRELLEYYLEQDQYMIDEVVIDDMVRDLRTIAKILLGTETP